MKPIVALLTLLSISAHAINTSRDYFGLPAILSGAGTPIVLLAMSNDHQLFYKAYTDWDDLDPSTPGIPENTYAHEVDYYAILIMLNAISTTMRIICFAPFRWRRTNIARVVVMASGPGIS